MPAHPSRRDSTTKVLLAEPSEATRWLIAKQLPRGRYQLIEVRDGLSAWDRYQKQRPGAVLSGFELPGLQGPELLARVRRRARTPFLFHTTRHDVRVAISAIRQGADDVLVLPDHADLISERLERLVGERSGTRNAADALASIIGLSPLVRAMRDQIAGAIGLRIPVLLRGERGTGHSHVAACLAWADGSSLCTITSTRPRAPQKSDAARTVHLKDVDRIPLDLQALWLRELHAIEREKPDAPRRLVLSTTETSAGADAALLEPSLAQRLAPFTILLPPLRQRRGDVIHLSRHLLSRIAGRLGRRHASISDRALAELRSQSWPGNVTELENALERLVAFAPDGRIGRRDVLAMVRPESGRVGLLRRVGEQEQREELVALLRETRGNLAETARRLGMSRGAVIYRAQKFGLMPRRTSGKGRPR